MYYFYTYGFLNGDILEQKDFLESCLGFSLHEKDSGYCGVAYSHRNEINENFILQENYDGEGFLEESYEHCPLVFNATIQGQEKAETLKEKILLQEGAILIKSRRLSI